MKHCPECQAVLEHKTYKVFHAWTCPEGHGTYYPAGELANIVEAISGLGNLEMELWSDHENYSVIESPLISPDANRHLWEIRDKAQMHIMVYGDPESHALWVFTGEEEKLLEHIESEMAADSVSSYVALAAEESAKIFDDNVTISEATGHMITSFKLLGERLVRAMPHITI